MLNEIDSVSDGVTDVEGLDGAFQEVRNQAIKRWPGKLRRVTAGNKNGLEFGLAAEKGVEEVAEPGDGK